MGQILAALSLTLSFWTGGGAAARPDLETELRGALGEARAALEALDHGAARARITDAVERALGEAAGGGERVRRELLAELGAFAHGARALEAAERARRRLVELSADGADPDHPAHLAALADLAATLSRKGDLEGALAIDARVFAARERTLAPDDPLLTEARFDLGRTHFLLGDYRAAHGHFAAVAEVRGRTLPEDHPELLTALGSLAAAMKSLGDLAGSMAIEEVVLAARLRTLPPDDPALLISRMNLGSSLVQLGRDAEAEAIFAEVAEVRRRTLAPDDPQLLLTLGNLASARRHLGDLHGAQALWEEILAIRERSLPPDHPSLVHARLGLARTRSALGDLAGARSLLEGALAAFERRYPPEHPDLLAARASLALVLKGLGDYPAARVLEEDVLAARERSLSPGHPELHAARTNLAVTLKRLGEPAAARALEEALLARLQELHPPDHTLVQVARGNLAGSLRLAGEFERALDLRRAVLAAYEGTLAREHPRLLLARQNLATSLGDLGRLEEAVALFAEVLSVRREVLPPDHPGLATALLNRITEGMRLAARDVRAPEEPVPAPLDLEPLFLELLSCELAATRSALLQGSVREAEERASRSATALGLLCALAQGVAPFGPRPDLAEAAFRLSEATRAAGLALARRSRAAAGDPESVALAAELGRAAAALARLVERGAERDAYHSARARREELERRLAARAPPGPDPADLTPRALAAALGPDRALVTLRRATDLALLPDPGGPRVGAVWTRREALFAFVLRPGPEGGEPELALVDLGPIEEVDGAVRAWRRELGVGAERGLGVDPGDRLASTGRRLRELLWDPLVPALGPATRVCVVLDDVAHLVPFDALPGPEAAGHLGDRWRIETRVAAWELLEPAPPLAGGPGRLVTLGGAAFNSAPEGEGGGGPEELDRDPAPAPGRGLALERAFAPLSYAALEAREVAALFDEVFGGAGEGRVLQRRGASRTALLSHAPGARWLHVATHGWFAPGAIRSWADPAPADALESEALRAGGADVLRAMSPMLLAGLALAGANLEPDASGRAPGLLTAEELSGLDLTGCELAVLSACDTNVGERRAGQGVASLQKALHMAGARSVITSLWKVPDQATSDLMLDFYRRLWVEQKPKHQALWEAKLRLRHAKDERGQPLYAVRDWAAWVLTGDPD